MYLKVFKGLPKLPLSFLGCFQRNRTSECNWICGEWGFCSYFIFFLSSTHQIKWTFRRKLLMQIIRFTGSDILSTVLWNALIFIASSFIWHFVWDLWWKIFHIEFHVNFYDNAIRGQGGISVKNMQLIGDIICNRFYENSKLLTNNL